MSSSSCASRIMALWMSLLLMVTMQPTAMAALSEQCQKETELLANNTALAAAVPPKLDCHINLDETDSCQVDYSSYSSNFETKCLAAGGQFLESDYSLDCSVTLSDPYGSSKVYNADYYFLNAPLCLGMSCTLADYEEEQETVVYPALEQELSSQGFQCNVSGAAPSVSSLLTIVVVLGSALSMIGSLW